MIRINYFCFFLCGLFFANTLVAQDFTGPRIGNYSTISSLSLNPAHMHSGNLFWNLSLGGIDISFQQNYAHFGSSNYFSARRKLAQAEKESANSDLDYVDALINHDFEFDNFRYKSKISAHGQIAGPGFWIRMGDLGFGVFSNFQSWFNIDNAPYKTEIDYWNEIPQGTDFELDRMRLGLFSYSEIGLNTSLSFENLFDIPLILGLNAKYLIPHDVIYIANHENTISARFNDSLYVDRGEIQVDYFSGFMESENTFAYTFSSRGYGFAFDLGLKYLTGSGPNGYKYKFGLSLNDLGQLYYRNGAHHSFHFIDGYIDQGSISNDFIQDEANKDGLDVLNAVYSSRRNRTSFHTPTHIAAELDYSVFDNYYLTASVIRNLDFKNKIDRISYITLVPRYESRWISAGLPLSFINDQFLRLGVFARFGPLSLGTDHLISWIVPSNYRGTSLYMSLQLNADFFEALGWGISGYKIRVVSPSKKVKCYRF